MSDTPHEVQYVTIHGHQRAFVKRARARRCCCSTASGCDHTTWEPVIDALARRYTVIAPDLLGHGQSAKPRADYSVGGYANGMRDLLTVLGIDKVTVVGHSFGGGVAMQFAYQFPERTERMVLVASGGLGPEVTPAIRAVTTPGFHQVMGVLTLPGVRHVGMAGLRALSRTGLQGDPRPRRGRRHLRVVPGPARPRRDPARRPRRRRLARPDRDHGRPRLPDRGDADVRDLGHATTRSSRSATPRTPPRSRPSARVEVIPNAGHFPHKDHPQRFVKILHEFIRTTQPASYSRARLARRCSRPRGAGCRSSTPSRRGTRRSAPA